MPILDLSIDELLTTTRAVRKRLDLTRPVEVEVIQECLNIALQAPSPGSGERWRFVVITDSSQREALAALYRKAATPRTASYKGQALAATDEKKAVKLVDSVQYLIDHLHEVPVFVIPCIEGRTENLPVVEQSSLWSSILPATWNFMLAARSRGLGTVLTTIHLSYEREAADVLGIPYEQIMQTALIPVAYTLGTEFKPATRKSLEAVVHWNRW
jgi:nitroreductase